MCSLIVTNKSIPDLSFVNYFTKFRGPDHTEVLERDGITFVHNLLSITGALTVQPFVDEEKGVVALFNGQIYNYRSFGEYKSDGEVLIPLYEKYGAEFVRRLDGEFALVLVDFKKRIAIASTDVFATKPLWIAEEEGKIGFASYKSALIRLGFPSPAPFPPNTTRMYRIPEWKVIETKSVFNFDVRAQSKTTVDDFVAAFDAALEKRSAMLREKIFIGLSSGYDSGAIASGLQKRGVPFKAYSIEGEENLDVLIDRHARAPEAERIRLSYQEYSKAKFYLKLYAEDFTYPIFEEHRTNRLSDDSGAIGLSAICARAKAEGLKIYFSGQGSDEILSDYGSGGKKFASHSTFGGKFPENLASYFPWRNFYGGAQRAYLAKEEYVSGSYGLEGRYPFLDPRFVQEFLWLSPDLKNKEYKYPLREYLSRNNYPTDAGNKVGFVLGTYPLSAKLTPASLAVRLSYYGRYLFSHR